MRFGLQDNPKSSEGALTWSSALAVPIGENLLINTLSTHIPRETTAVTPEAVIQAGANGLPMLISDPTVLNSLRFVYSSAVTNVLYLSTATIAVGLPCALCMERRNVRREGQMREGQNALVKTPSDRGGENTSGGNNTRSSSKNDR